MADAVAQFSGSIPEAYDGFLVPLIFEPYADDLADRVLARSPDDILETAAGTGAVTRALARRLSPSVRYTATDLSQPMLDYAQSRQPAEPRVTWLQADALVLPFDNASVDVVLCQFGVMFFPDRVAGFAEARRVLRPGGALLFNAWDVIAANAFAAVVAQVAADAFPNDPPQFLARTPHGYHDAAVIRSDLLKAGFAEVAIDTIEKVSKAPSPRHPAIAYCRGTPLRSEIEARDPGLLDLVVARAADTLAERFGAGEVSGRIKAHVVTASR